jgi:hypothetical protein
LNLYWIVEEFRVVADNDGVNVPERDTQFVTGTYYGVATARISTSGKKVRNRLLGYPRIDVDEEIARVAGELLAEADDSAGEDAGVGPNDAYIAAMAEVLGDAVLTANVDDFETLGVPVETY